MCQFVKLFVVAFEEFVEDPRLQKRATFLALAMLPTTALGVGLVIKEVGGHVTYADDRRYRPRPPSTEPPSTGLEHQVLWPPWPWGLLRGSGESRSPDEVDA